MSFSYKNQKPPGLSRRRPDKPFCSSPLRRDAPDVQVNDPDKAHDDEKKQ
jgi:hypothetical protein